MKSYLCSNISLWAPLRVAAWVLASSFWGTDVGAQTTYFFDVNANTSGSGVAGSTSYSWTGTSWTTRSAGANSGSPVVAWVSGSNANFSAGTDGTGTFQVTIASAVTANTVTQAEGTPNFKASANFTISTASTLSTSALTLAAGTLTLGGTGSYSFNALYVTGNSVLDFGSAVTGGSTLTFGSIYIDPGATLEVRNWASGTDSLIATNVFSGAGGTLTDGISPSYSGTSALSAGSSVTGVTLSATSAAGATAYWNGASLGFATTPVPEPSTYGAMLMAGCAGLFGLRRWRACGWFHGTKRMVGRCWRRR